MFFYRNIKKIENHYNVQYCVCSSSLFCKVTLSDIARVGDCDGWRWISCSSSLEPKSQEKRGNSSIVWVLNAWNFHSASHWHPPSFFLKVWQSVSTWESRVSSWILLQRPICSFACSPSLSFPYSFPELNSLLHWQKIWFGSNQAWHGK